MDFYKNRRPCFLVGGGFVLGQRIHEGMSLPFSKALFGKTKSLLFPNQRMTERRMLFMAIQDDIQKAIQMHAMWRVDLLKTLASGLVHFDLEILKKDDDCPLGQWLYSDAIPVAVKETEEYATCVELHKEFHVMTHDIAELLVQGRRHDVLRALEGEGPYHALSSRLIAHLRKWSASLEGA